MFNTSKDALPNRQNGPADGVQNAVQKLAESCRRRYYRRMPNWPLQHRRSFWNHAKAIPLQAPSTASGRKPFERGANACWLPMKYLKRAREMLHEPKK